MSRMSFCLAISSNPIKDIRSRADELDSFSHSIGEENFLVVL